MSKTVNSTAFSIKLRSNLVEIPYHATMITTVNGVSTEVSILQHTRIPSRRKIGDIGNVTQRSPPGSNLLQSPGLQGNGLLIL